MAEGLKSLFVMEAAAEGRAPEYFVVDTLRNIYDRLDNMLANMRAGDPRRRAVVEFARRVRIAEALWRSTRVREFLRNLSRYQKFRCMVSSAELILDTLDPARVVRELCARGYMRVEPMYGFVRELAERGVAEVRREELGAALKLVEDGVARLLLVLDGLPFDDLFFKSSYNPRKEDPEKIRYNLDEIGKLLDQLPEEVKEYLLPHYRELRKRVEGRV